ncbi:MAG: sel1 repeat family protein [Muribaculaceae bacterium]|nr:sel1 repeat family protein [Muribaculaceae bacterium]
MKKLILLVSILAVAMSAQAFSFGLKSSKKRYITPEEVHVTVTPAEKQKADAIYESVRKAYAQGSLTADGVVDKALYHKTWSPELAARCLQLVADKNNRAKAELGYLYTYFKTAYLFPNQEAEGVRLMEAAANAGNKNASDYLGIYYNRKKDYKKALKYFNAAGNDHVPYAYTMIGGMYESGNGVKKDRTKAREYYQKAARLGDSSGAQKYGAALKKGWFGKVDMPDAFFWTYIAGDLGSDFARSNLLLPIRGERFGDDKQTAFMRNGMTLADAWNEQYGEKLKDEPIYKEGYAVGLAARGAAAEKGDPWSLFYLGSMSYNDEFLNHKSDFIRECYEPLLDNKTLPDPALALVYERLADIYSKGDGVKADAAKAKQYNRKAADYGSLAAYKIVEQIP